ncbi:ABC transporter permease [Aureimonas flava]|uniref:ABC transporter permease n=1 Tax=Aureimonas flava TaxID=2320271 RepID=A0A3A1WFE0_9HYPH|nr:iron chelate uptake ABC transporter family permease subunit [Aureimonas flava]RIX98470.1 ABC transporter permease [Aureimonas flava]
MVPLLSAVLATALLAVASLFVGVGDVSPAALISAAPEDRAALLLAASRVPRTLAILLAGSSLAIGGLVMQMIVRNRFAEPSTTGTTEAATLGLLLATLLAPGWPPIAKMAVSALFALGGTALFLRILRFVPLRDAMLVPLVGLMFGGVIGALATFLALRFQLLPSLLAWTTGDFSAVLRGRYELLWLGLGATLLAYWAADRLTLAGMGRDVAVGLGLNHEAATALGLVLVSVIAAVSLASVGAIPFLGLVVPNLVSLAVGDNMRATVPWVAIGGAALVLACDILGRLLRYPYEIPIGVVMGVLGSALFLALLLRTRRHGA